MPTFTVIRGYIPTMGHEGYGIESIARDIQADLLDGMAKGHKVTWKFGLVPSDNGSMFQTLNLLLVNRNGRVIEEALLIGEQPEIATRKYHANAGPGQYITCTTCENTDQMFYYIDRDRFYNRLLCQHCGSFASTLTETGACT